MITTITDGIAILAIRNRSFDVFLAILYFIGLVVGIILIPLALIGWGIWAVFFAQSAEEPATPVSQPVIEAAGETKRDEVVIERLDAEIERAVVIPRPVQPSVQPEPSLGTENATLLDSMPPKPRSEHLEAARSAVKAFQADAATYNIKMLMQYDLQKGRELSQEVKDLMKDGVGLRLSGRDLGEFVSLASEKYKSQWSPADQRVYEMMRGVIKRMKE